MLAESAVELCDWIWLLNPDESELVQKVRARAVSQMSRVRAGGNRPHQSEARSLLQCVQSCVAV